MKRIVNEVCISIAQRREVIYYFPFLLLLKNFIRETLKNYFNFFLVELIPLFQRDTGLLPFILSFYPGLLIQADVFFMTDQNLVLGTTLSFIDH